MPNLFFAIATAISFGKGVWTQATLKAAEHAAPVNLYDLGLAEGSRRKLGRSSCSDFEFSQLGDCLTSSHRSCRLDRQPQRPAECSQVAIPRPAVIRLPEVCAGLADAGLLGNFCDRLATLSSEPATVVDNPAKSVPTFRA